MTRPDLILYGGRVITLDPALALLAHMAGRRPGRPRQQTASSRRLSAFRAPTRSGPPGKLADLVVLSDDPMTCAEIQIRDITAEMTIVGGRVVHERGRSAA